jgi:hypothetical protein
MLMPFLNYSCYTPKHSRAIANNEAKRPKDVKSQNNNLQASKESPPRVFDEGTPEAEFFRHFFADGHYRVARAADFRIPEVVVREYAHDINIAINLPCVGGDFNLDGAGDRACIVVDNTRNDMARFGLVIFNGLKEKETMPQLFWLYQGRNLAKTVMGWSRDGLDITEYHEDGTYSICHVRWDKEQQDYICK